MLYFLTTIRIFHREIKGLFADGLRIYTSRLWRISERFLQLHKLGEIVII